jgi:alkylation response protein AidB-like acyl-CoA dehydrogenase
VTAALDLAFDDAQQAIADSLAQFCAERFPAQAVKALENRFPEEAWRELAALGVLALATPEGDGGAAELVAALEALGRAVFPGPLVATCFATQLLPPEDRARVVAGDAVVSVGQGDLWPWAPRADLFVLVEGERAFRCRPTRALVPLETLGGEPWGRAPVERLEELGDTARAHSLHDLALAAYLAAAADGLVEATAEHARTRRQFGRPIGEFQAVAHPLADCHVALAGVRALARAAAFRFDTGAADARATAAAARVAAQRAGVEAAHTCHQLFGAQGITLEGPVFHVSRRIRQLASQPPGAAGSREALLARFGV